MSDKYVVLSNGITGKDGLAFFYKGDVVIGNVLGDDARLSKLLSRTSIRIATPVESELDTVHIEENVRKTVEQNVSEANTTIQKLNEVMQKKDAYIRSLEANITSLEKELNELKTPKSASAKK